MLYLTMYLFENKYCLNQGRDRKSNNQFNHVTCVCLSKATTRISIYICCGLFVLNGFRWNVVVPSVDIGRILDNQRVCLLLTTGATSGAGTAYPSGALEFNPGFSGVRVTQSVVICVMVCRSFSVLFLLAIVLSDLRFLITPLVSSDYSFII